MPRSALPPHLQNFNWKGTDNASWLMRQKKKVQIWLAAGPRVPSGFWKWREVPRIIFAIRGEGSFRLENTDGTDIHQDDCCNPYPNKDWNNEFKYYLSRIQPWTRWHLSLQWPLFFNFHIIYRQKNVVDYPTYQSAFGIKKMLTFGFGFKRDGDKVYWLTANLGGNFE